MIRVGVAETFGLVPFAKAAREAVVAVRGDPETPKTRFDRTSLALLRPRLSFPLWLGRRRADRRIEIYNYFNRTPTPIEDGWSVRVTQARDYGGGRRTYDSHNGTDFAIPVGTVVVAAAPGRVLRVASEFHRGGLKVFVDHGRGLATSYNHLARALVRPGDLVRRGDRVALSGSSGIDGFLFFPWSVPHVHFNVWLDGAYVDPFAVPGEVPLWRGPEGLPVPHDGSGTDEAPEPGDWAHEEIAAIVRECRHPGMRCELEAIDDADQRAMGVLFATRYFPTRFARRLPRLYRTRHERAPWLDLPFRRQDFDGIVAPAFR
jgi:murein DD-endopeptidase